MKNQKIEPERVSKRYVLVFFSIFCFISQTTTGNTINTEFDEAFFNEKNKKMFISTSSGVKTGDRAEFSTVNLQVGDIDNLRYPGVSVCELIEDERP